MNHNHTWYLTSSHRTSEGPIRYLACDCGVYRIERAAAPMTDADTVTLAVVGPVFVNASGDRAVELRA